MFAFISLGVKTDKSVLQRNKEFIYLRQDGKSLITSPTFSPITSAPNSSTIFYDTEREIEHLLRVCPHLRGNVNFHL